MRDGGKGDKRRPLVIPEEQFNAQWDSIFGHGRNKRDLIQHVETTYVERRVPEDLEDEAHEVIDKWLRSKGYNPESI